MSVTASPPRRLTKGGVFLSPGILGGYGLVVGFALLTLALILIHVGGILNIGFPLGAATLAAVLFVTRRGVYVAFVWWIWLFSPLVRRLVDFQSGYHSLSPVIITPLLVTLFATFALAARPRVFLRRRFLPFSLFALVLLYGLFVGLFLNGLAASLYDFTNWVVPLAFGFFLLTDTRHAAENREAFIQAAIIGLLGTSLYGIYQFFDFPPWDEYWLVHSHFAAAGPGVSEQVRLFGPLNSPGPYSIALMAPLVFALAAKGPLKILASAAGYPAFGLSLVRSVWGGWLLAVAYLVFRIGGKLRLRIFSTALVIGFLAFPLLTIGPVADQLAKRFATFSNLQQDGSVQQRESLYENFTGTAFSQPIGLGLGYNGLATKLNAASTPGFDSGMLEIPYEFGWIGGATIIWAISMLVLRILLNQRFSGDHFEIACGGVLLAVLGENLAGLNFAGSGGIIMWSAAAFAYKTPMAVPRCKGRP
jgi:hypothetical protein